MRHRRARQSAAQEHVRHALYQQGANGLAKGRALERQVGRALALLVEWGCILSYTMSKPNDRMDKAGIDAVFVTLADEQIVFQVKANERGVRKHMKKHADIPCVNFEGRTFVPDIAELIRQTFNLPEPLMVSA